MSAKETQEYDVRTVTVRLKWAIPLAAVAVVALVNAVKTNDIPSIVLAAILTGAGLVNMSMAIALEMWHQSGYSIKKRKP